MSDPSISEKVKEIVTNHQKSGWVVSFDRENGTATFRKGPDMIKILDLQTGRFTQDSTMGPMW